MTLCILTSVPICIPVPRSNAEQENDPRSEKNQAKHDKTSSGVEKEKKEAEHLWPRAVGYMANEAENS